MVKATSPALLRRLRWLFVAVCFWFGTAAAQTAMPNPRAMSGIPLPDEALPAGTVVVRVVAETMAKPLVKQTVVLKTAAASVKTALTDAAGRATFSAVQPGRYVASCAVAAFQQESQPFQVASSGVRVLLAFPKEAADAATKDSGNPTAPDVSTVPAPNVAPSTTASLSASVANTGSGTKTAPGTLRVVVSDEQKKPLANVPVTLYRRAGPDSPVEKLPIRPTASDGSLVWTDLATGDAEYLVTFFQFGYDQPSEPFHLPQTDGRTLELVARPPVSIGQARNSLSLAGGSHILLELQEDMLAVTEVLHLRNPLPQAVLPDPDGLRIELPTDAISPQLLPGNPSTVNLDQSSPGNVALVFKGPVPPGNTFLQVRFLLRHGGELSFVQSLGVHADDLRVVLEKRPGLSLDDLSDLKERDFQGRQLWFGLPKNEANHTVSFKLSGLPKEHRATRLWGGVMALIVLAVFVVLSWKKAGRTRPGRSELLAQKETLLVALAAQNESGSAKKSQETRQKLLSVYRALDEGDA